MSPTKFGNFRGNKIQIAAGKYSKQAVLPNRAALNQLTKGNPEQQSLGNYAKLTPSGAAGATNYQSIIDMANKGG